MPGLVAVALGDLLQVVWISVGASVVVCGAFSIVVREGGRSAEARRARRGGAAAVHAGLAALFFLAFAVIVTYGVVTMLRKS